jgi:hypothetical protein
MQLILAIVADHQQAAQLAALIDGRLAVDLVQAAEVGEGLLALNDRIPDLILTPPLMSPFDDGVLDEYLRDLGPAGAHVQTIRIPVLSQAPKKAPRLGFSLRRRSKPEAPTLDGCEPKVFADEIALYLARAAEEKSHASKNEQAPVIERHVVQDTAATQPISEEEWTAAYDSDAPGETAAWSAPEPEPEPAAGGWRSDLLDRPPLEEAPTYEQHTVETEAAWQEDIVEAPASAQDPETPIYEPVETVHVQYEAEDQIGGEVVEEPPHVAVLDERVTSEAYAAEPAVVEKPIATPTVVARPLATDTAPAVEREDPHSDKATPSFKAALAAIRAAWGKPSSKEGVPAPAQEAIAPPETKPVATVPDAEGPLEVDLTGEVELLDEPAGARHQSAPEVPRPFAPAESPESADVYELSVEPDMKELESELSAPSPVSSNGTSDPLPEPAGDRRKKPAKRTNKTAKAKGPRQPQPQTAQDEWGMFDPNRCGFAAVVDKLDEASDKKVEQPRTGGKARVISLS